MWWPSLDLRLEDVSKKPVQSAMGSLSQSIGVSCTDSSRFFAPVNGSTYVGHMVCFAKSSPAIPVFVTAGALLAGNGACTVLVYVCIVYTMRSVDNSLQLYAGLSVVHLPPNREQFGPRIGRGPLVDPSWCGCTLDLCKECGMQPMEVGRRGT